ncbi:MAG: hypothetical protein SFT68_05630 [Rickettsiaceae bacterium]|nr:hypothetical protein [Rickettsiaceae bacterium]
MKKVREIISPEEQKRRLKEVFDRIDNDPIIQAYSLREETLDINMLILHDFAHEDVKWREAFYWFESICKELNIEPTRSGINGIEGKNYGNSVKSLTYKGGKNKLEKYNFEEIEDYDVYCMYDKKSDTCDIKSYFGIRFRESFGFMKSYISVMFEESLYPYNIENYKDLAKKLQSFTKAKYGYVHTIKLGLVPELYATGSHKLSIDGSFNWGSENSPLWYKKYNNKEGGYKIGDLREVYKLNFLSKEHLEREVETGLNLKYWIEQDSSRGSLSEVSEGFWSWSVPESRLIELNQYLMSKNIVIAFDEYKDIK